MRMQIWAARSLQKAALKMQSRNTGTRFARRRKMWPLKVTLPGCWRLPPTHRSETDRNRFCLLNRQVAYRVVTAYLSYAFWPLLMLRLDALMKPETQLTRNGKQTIMEVSKLLRRFAEQVVLIVG